MALLWSATTKSANLTVSADRTILTQGAAADGSQGYFGGSGFKGLGDTSRNSGKPYFEVKLLDYGNNSGTPTIGLATASANYDSRTGADGYPISIGWRSNGDEQTQFYGNIGSYSNGDTIGIGIDFAATKITVWRNGVQTFTNSFFAATGPWFPAATPGGRMSIAGGITDLAYLPAGYEAWDGSIARKAVRHTYWF